MEQNLIVVFNLLPKKNDESSSISGYSNIKNADPHLSYSIAVHLFIVNEFS